VSEPDYTKMQPGEMLESVGDDAAKWTDAFMQTVAKEGTDKIVEWDCMVAWFANASEHSTAVRAKQERLQ